MRLQHNSLGDGGLTQAQRGTRTVGAAHRTPARCPSWRPCFRTTRTGVATPRSATEQMVTREQTLHRPCHAQIVHWKMRLQNPATPFRVRYQLVRLGPGAPPRTPMSGRPPLSKSRSTGEVKAKRRRRPRAKQFISPLLVEDSGRYSADATVSRPPRFR